VRAFGVLLPSGPLPFGVCIDGSCSHSTKPPIKPVISRLKSTAIKAYSTRDQHPLMQTIGSSLPEVKRPLDDAPAPDADANESGPQVAINDIFGSLFDSGHIIDPGFFATKQPPNPATGGMNLYFAPPQEQPLAASSDPLFGLGPQNNGLSVTDLPIVGDTGAMWLELMRQLGSSPPAGQADHGQ